MSTHSCLQGGGGYFLGGSGCTLSLVCEGVVSTESYLQMWVSTLSCLGGSGCPLSHVRLNVVVYAFMSGPLSLVL